MDKFRFGGGENLAVNYAIVLNKLNIENYIVADYMDDKFLEKLKNHKIKYLNKKEFKENTNDILFIHTNRNLLKMHTKYFWKKEKPKMYYIQHLFYSEKKLKMLSKMINHTCKGFIQITPITRDMIKKHIKTQIYFFPNFYINKYDEKEKLKIRNELRKELKISDNDYIVTFSGVFKKGKNVSHIIELSKQLKNYKNIKFLILGDGPEREIVKNNLNNNIIWPGLVNDVEKYLHISDLYFFPSRKEMMPLALIEAINADLPIVAYNTELNKFLLEERFIVDNLSEAKDKVLEFYNSNLRKYSHDNKFDLNFGIKNLKKILWS
ncbi:glycosyltransferase [Marinitoga lauensis]|uniref:glycosyltransferase n=1 Tax=Marinitoga lauensis TaxID=2201189 RepID=UPI001404D417|nr:glycosyltransferase [Marinitoga lauensis]